MDKISKLYLIFIGVLYIASCTDIQIEETNEHNTPQTTQVLFNANIITMNEDQPVAEAMAVDQGRIIAVGSKEEVLAITGEVKGMADMQGQTIVPGFIESHDHMFMASAVSLVTDIQPFTTPSVIEALKKISTTKPNADGWILGFGADQELYQEKRGPHIDELDKLFPEHPVMIFHLSGHGGFANSQAFKLAGIDKHTENPQGGFFEKDDTGELTGYISGQPALFKVKNYPDASKESAYNAASQRAAAGVTTASELALMNKTIVEQLSQYTSNSDFPVRLVAGYFSSASDLKEMMPKLKSYENELFQIPFIKTWTDGSIQGGTGSLIDGYYDPKFGSDGAQGTQEFFNEQVSTIFQHGFWPAIHANGDNAVDIALNAIEYAQEEMKKAGHGAKAKTIRPQIIHAQVTSFEQLKRMKALDANPTFFMTHVYYWGDLHYETTLGPELANRLNALGDAFKLDLKAAMHNDPPVTPVNPLLNIWIATQRKTTSGRIIGKEQATTAKQALQAYTSNAAYQLGVDEKTGSLEVGKYADYVILDRNILTIPTDEIKEVNILKTVRGGLVTFEKQ